VTVPQEAVSTFTPKTITSQKLIFEPCCYVFVTNYKVKITNNYNCTYFYLNHTSRKMNPSHSISTCRQKLALNTGVLISP